MSDPMTLPLPADWRDYVQHKKECAKDKPQLVCPQCFAGLKFVTQGERSPLNEYQFDSVKAGDYYCDRCEGNEASNTAFKYFWTRELAVYPCTCGLAALLAAVPASEIAPHGAWLDPTPEMLADPRFEAIWQCIKSWDINVPHAYAGYMGATGNHVRAILDALAGPISTLQATVDQLQQEKDAANAQAESDRECAIQLMQRLTAAEAEIARWKDAVEDAEREATDCWGALSFNWDTMPPDLRRCARDTVRDGLYALGTRLRAYLKGWNGRDVAAPVKSRAELLRARLTEREAQLGTLQGAMERVIKYVRHAPDCTGYRTVIAVDAPSVCTCGLADLLAAVPAHGGQQEPVIRRIAKDGNHVRYAIDGHDETLRFSGGSDANKVWELLRRMEALLASRVPSEQEPEQQKDTNTRVDESK